MFLAGLGWIRKKSEPCFFAKITFWKKINSQTFFAILLKNFSMHEKNENGGRPKSALADLLSVLSTEN